MDVSMHADDMTVVINMDVNAREHLEYSVEENFDGTFCVTDFLCGGWRIVYAGFPTRNDAERFVLNQPECFDTGKEKRNER